MDEIPADMGPRSLRCHMFRTAAALTKPNCCHEHDTSMVCVLCELNRRTAMSPLASGLYHTCAPVSLLKDMRLPAVASAS